MMMFLYAESANQTSGFKFINWLSLLNYVQCPPKLANATAEEAKRRSAAITASDAPSKQLGAITEHNHFTLLRLDLDDTEHTIKSICDLMKGMGIYSYLIHTTASHRQSGKGDRYRVYIELEHGLTLDEWRLLQTYLAYVVGADDCSNRPQQIMYLPVRFAGGIYRSHINKGPALKVYDSQLFSDAIAFDVDQKRQAEALEREKASQIKPQYQERLIAGQVSIIEAINQGYEWASLLAQYGYRRQGRAWLAPESSSKIGGVYLLTGHDGKQRYYSHHTNDPCAIGKCLDKFDFITMRSFGGDRLSALKAMAKYFPAHDKHNKQQYIRHQQALKLRAIKESLQ